MATGSRATFVIPWAQTETDGLRAAMPSALVVGATWRWSGEAVRMDAPAGPLRLEAPQGAADLSRRAALRLRRLIAGAGPSAGPRASPRHRAEALSLTKPGRPAASPRAQRDATLDEWAQNVGAPGFLLSDGSDCWNASILGPGAGAGGGERLVLFLGAVPPKGRLLWVVKTRIAAMALPGLGSGSEPPMAAAPGGVICFTAATRIMTPTGAERVECLRPGDRVVTRDNGPQEILWTGSRRISGARLYALPHLRPVLLRQGALGQTLAGEPRPDGDLLVSPQHRLLVGGTAARALFNSDEVLVAAGDLINDHSIHTDFSCREVSYHHLLLAQHEVVFANGVASESFHPAAADLGSLASADRERLLALMPGLDQDPMRYGAFSRRSLTACEAALLRHGA